jgi:uncharacterized protein
MLIGVVSDTHGQRTYTQDAVRILETFPIETVIHCGDIGAPEIVSYFSKWPTHFVLGNVDYEELDEIEAAVRDAGQHFHGPFGSLELAGKKIAFLHSDDARTFRSTIESGEWDLVCYGHTHVAKEEWVGNTLVLNPGALYRAYPHTLAIVELPERKVTSLKV